jgi:hypothetical protein
LQTAAGVGGRAQQFVFCSDNFGCTWCNEALAKQVLNSPKLEAVAIDEDGWPVPMRVPDPRAFALHKAWLSGLPEREPLKKPRDLEQARSVAKLVVDEMPHLPFESTLTSLHGDVRKMLPMLIQST